MICYIAAAAVAVLGALAIWTSGRDVGYRNAVRDAEQLHEDDLVLCPGKDGRK